MYGGIIPAVPIWLAVTVFARTLKTKIPKKKSIQNRFNTFERVLQKIPTWLAITGIVVPLAIVTVLVNVNFEQDWSTSKIALESFKAIFENLESIAIVSAVILYFKESPDRKYQKHYEA